MKCLKLTNYKQTLPRRWTVLCRDFRQKNTTNYNYQFDYDNIGNRITSSNNDVTTNYSTNNLNQYENMGDFVPLFDADGNQTKIKTSKGEFLVVYNGENRPVKFTNVSDSTFITMRYDYMGRRGGKLHFNSQGTWTSTVKFFYKDYTLIEESTASNDVLKEFVWDPTAGEATRPLYMKIPQEDINLFYLHDANKNVTEVSYLATANGIGAHYEYSPFGEITTATKNTRVTTVDILSENPFRFSSEYHDDVLGLIYYNYRHYNPQSGRWLSRDPIEEKGGYNLYGMCDNNTINSFDLKGEMSPIVPAIAALATTIYLCVEPLATKAQKDFPGETDSFWHCWTSCRISKACGNAMAQFAGLSKEAKDAVRRLLGEVGGGTGTWEDSLDDLIANNKCIGWESNIGPIGGWVGACFRESCECCCKRETKNME